jgi:RNA polymerase subunit RPABC4/transcription elongation factor Spt4
MNRSEQPKEKERRCFCPYCEEELAISTVPYCQPCGVTLRYCIRCKIAVVRDATVCPECGGELEWK